MKITYKDKTIEIQEPQKVIDVFKEECLMPPAAPF